MTHNADYGRCNAADCDLVADLALRIFNNYSFRTRPAGPLFYCHDHGTTACLRFTERGLRVEVEPMHVDSGGEAKP
jgi:hypothetical protein